MAICSRNLEAARAAAQEIEKACGTQVRGYGADVSDPQDVRRLLDEVRGSLGDPEILVTNAGGPPPGTYADTAVEEYEKALRLNLMSAVHLIHGVTGAMKAAGWGRIIAITSISV